MGDCPVWLESVAILKGGALKEEFPVLDNVVPMYFNRMGTYRIAAYCSNAVASPARTSRSDGSRATNGYAAGYDVSTNDAQCLSIAGSQLV